MTAIINEVLKRQAEAYLSERKGTYEMRCQRYSAVFNALKLMGLDDHHLLMDLGAGMCDFDVYLRSQGWRGRYLPVDKSIDGTDVRTWTPRVRPDFITAIELIEHLPLPMSHVQRWAGFVKYGMVLTTPNTDRLGERAVIEMDRTHVSPVRYSDLHGPLWVEEHSFFGRPNDSYLAGWGGVPLRERGGSNVQED